ncbi:hypothetical protein STIAU_2333 [Stigmatella aurantiaca DW4/3-1]|uniref:Uncharacterized protein n=1 Tax=Stigmatella aurantiaca (strain DW4/3-1) TaxID=378806 RepID=Q08WI5_STIAD|nr:hypothetical protein STIAU_2333 [Stigmatella aurantiaca DW4/3-1]
MKRQPPGVMLQEHFASELKITEIKKIPAMVA